MTAQKIRLIMILSLLSLVVGSSAQQDTSPPTPPSGVKVSIGDIPEPKSQTSGPIAGTSGATRVRISSASNGDYHMVYLLPTSELQGEVTEGKIYYARYRNGIWSETLLCADLGAQSVPINFADVAGDKNGDAYIVWVSRDRNRFYFVTIRDASEVNIESGEAQNALRADVVVDGLDFVRAMYRNKLPSERNFFLSRPIEASTWQTISETPFEHRDGQRQPSIAAGTSGDVFYAYRWMAGGSGDRKLALRKFDGGSNTWSDIVDLFSAGSKPWGPQLTVDETNRVHMVWFEGGKTVYRAPDGKLTKLSLGEGENSWPPSIAVTEDGDITVVVTLGDLYKGSSPPQTVHYYRKVGLNFESSQPVDVNSSKQGWGCTASYKNSYLIVWVANNMANFRFHDN